MPRTRSTRDKATVEAALNKLKDALKGTDVAAIKAATEEASKAFYPIAEKMYQQANPQGGQQPGPDMGGPGRFRRLRSQRGGRRL